MSKRRNSIYVKRLPKDAEKHYNKVSNLTWYSTAKYDYFPTMSIFKGKCYMRVRNYRE